MAYPSAISSFSFNTNNIAAVGSVAFTLQRSPLDVTSIGSWNTYFIDGVATSAFSLDVYYSTSDHSALMNDILQPVTTTPGPVAFVITFGTTSGTPVVVDSVSGNCIITGFDIVAQGGDVVRGSISAQIVGPVTIAEVLAETGTAEIVPE